MRMFYADTETASLKGGICDVAYIEFDENLDVVSTFEQLLDPVVPIAPAAQAIHGISQAQVADEPTMAELIARDGHFFPQDEPFYIVGHNVKFDVRMLTAEGALGSNHTKVCTLRMARNLWPDIDPERENHKLGTLAVMFNLETGPAHRAMGDCVTGLNLLRYIANTAAVSDIEELMTLGTRHLSLDTYISFGKYGPNGMDKVEAKGTKLKDLPSSYVKWLRSQSDMDTDLIDALSAR